MNRNKNFLLVFLNLIFQLSVAQSNLDIPINQRVILSYPELIIYADILANEPSRIKPDNDLFYHWYNAHDIKTTRGGFDGKLLHGTYMEFYPNKNLKGKGDFRYGLKNGEWKSWYLTGELKEIMSWKKGKQHGSYKLFDPEGNLQEEGKFSKGCLEGKIKKYSKGECITKKYKKGKVVEEKCRRKIWDRFGKKKGRPSIDENAGKVKKNERIEKTKEDELKGEEKSGKKPKSKSEKKNNTSNSKKSPKK